jgi:N4-gp56 family major capsid protein
MAIDNFKPEMWASELLVALRKTLVFASPMVVNHDYEGEIQQGGDTVHISSVGDVAVSDYTKDSDLTFTPVDDAGTALVVDQMKYFAKTLDDVDAAQSVNGGRIMAQIMQNAAYNLSDVTDQYVASLYTQVSAANVLTAVTDFSPAGTAYNTLVDLGTKLDEANVPSEGRYAIVPPWFHARLRKDPNFINAEKSGSTEPLINGVVGHAAGFQISKSNNCQQPSAGTTYVIQAGTPMAISFANQIVKTAAGSMEKRFNDYVKGLHVYGAKVIYPDGLAYVVGTRS